MKKFAYTFIAILIVSTFSTNFSQAKEPQTYIVQHGDTYYSISRALKINPSELIKANGSKSLFPGDTLIVPSQNNLLPHSNDFITHIVKNQETLFKIAKDYNVKVNEIKTYNNITGNKIIVGQVLKIKKSITDNTPSYKKTTNDSPTINNTKSNLDNSITETNTNLNNVNDTSRNNITQSNGYHVDRALTTDSKLDVQNINDTSRKLEILSQDKEPITQTKNNTNHNSIGIVQQKGIGTWLSDSDLNFSKSVALHNQAAIGTIIKVTNPMNRRSIYAKVIGTFNENDNNKGAIIVISQSAATLLGALDKRFRINIEYSSK